MSIGRNIMKLFVVKVSFFTVLGCSNQKSLEKQLGTGQNSEKTSDSGGSETSSLPLAQSINEEPTPPDIKETFEDDPGVQPADFIAGSYLVDNCKVTKKLKGKNREYTCEASPLPGLTPDPKTVVQVKATLGDNKEEEVNFSLLKSSKTSNLVEGADFAGLILKVRPKGKLKFEEKILSLDVYTAQDQEDELHGAPKKKNTKKETKAQERERKKESDKDKEVDDDENDGEGDSDRARIQDVDRNKVKEGGKNLSRKQWKGKKMRL